MQFQGVLVGSLKAIELIDVFSVRTVILVGIEIRILHAIPVQTRKWAV
jgi:hypothetical protein